MKYSFLSLGMILFGMFGLVFVTTFESITLNNESEYYNLKETMEAAMLESVDLQCFRLPAKDYNGDSINGCNGMIKISEQKFVENFIKRFSNNLNGDVKDYKIDFYDIMESPPKATVVITGNSGSYKMSTDVNDFSYQVVNNLSGILEVNYADWDYNDCKVVFHDGNRVNTQTSNCTPSLCKLEENEFPAATGYEFAGWKLNPSGAVKYLDKAELKDGAINCDNFDRTVNLYASWQKIKVYVEYDKGTGDSGSVGKSTCYYGEPCILSSGKFVKLYHGMDGWSTSSGGAKVYDLGGTITDGITKNIKLYAHWVPAKYSISYNNNGGSGCDNKTDISGGTSVTLCSPTRAGYKFIGWALGTSDTKKYNPGEAITVAGDTNLRALWDKNHVYIRYNVNGGEWNGSTNKHLSVASGYVAYDNNSTTVFDYRYGDSINLNDYNNPNYVNIKRSGYVGVSGSEWCTSADASGACYNQGKDYPNAGMGNDKSLYFCDARNGDCTATVYVNWNKNPVKVNISVSKGTGISSVSGAKNNVNSGDSVTVTASKDNFYSFGGWYDANDNNKFICGSLSCNFNANDKNMSLVAKAIPVKFIFKYHIPQTHMKVKQIWNGSGYDNTTDTSYKQEHTYPFTAKIKIYNYASCDGTKFCFKSDPSAWKNHTYVATNYWYFNETSWQTYKSSDKSHYLSAKDISREDFLNWLKKNDVVKYNSLVAGDSVTMDLASVWKKEDNLSSSFSKK